MNDDSKSAVLTSCYYNNIGIKDARKSIAFYRGQNLLYRYAKLLKTTEELDSSEGEGDHLDSNSSFDEVSSNEDGYESMGVGAVAAPAEGEV